MQKAKKLKQISSGSKNKLSLLIGPLVIILLAGIISLDVSNRFQREQITQFNTQADNELRLATAKLDNYRDLLYAGRAYVLSSQSVTNQEWKSFYNQQAIFTRYPGVSSVAYVNNVSTQDVVAFRTKMMSQEYFGQSYEIKNLSKREKHGLISASVSENDISAIIGLDMLAQDDRYDVYRTAEVKGAIAASPSLKLATGYQGFFTILPVFTAEKLDGYVLTSFRYNDLMKELFENDTFGYEVTDITNETPALLYSSDKNTGEGNKLERTVDVGGRSWEIEISKKSEGRPLGYLLPAAIMVTSIVMATTLYAYANNPTRERFLRK